MEGFCRGCLIKYDDPDDLLEYTEKNRRLFIYSTGLQVKRNDIFTFQLCKDCYVNMNQSCRFKKLCRSSDKKFKTYLSLKEAGDTQDLCTYLKNNDDGFSLRWAGNSTPAKLEKDDDNESTCTSIRNFMQDMLPDTEMAASEARIVRQVIEEEADVLDDSLDSHWLQDDVSIATDFRLDFSPFSTPRSMSYGNCYTPSRQAGQTPDANRFDLLNKSYKSPKQDNDNDQRETESENKINDILSDSLLDNSFGENFENNIKAKNVYDETEIFKIENKLAMEEVDPPNDGLVNKVNCKNYYIDHTLVEQNTAVAQKQILLGEKPVTYVEFPAFGDHSGKFIEQPATFLDEPVTFVKQQLIFDGKDLRGVVNECSDNDTNKKLSNNEYDELVSLKDILGSPSVYPTQGESGLTPTINNILFGEKLDDSSQDQIGLSTENGIPKKKVYAEIFKMDPLISPLSMATDQIDLTDAKTDTPLEDEILQEENESKENGEASPPKDFLCHICDKKFKDMKCVKIHCAMVHSIYFPKKPRKRYDYGLMICNYCGKEYSDRRNFAQHVKRHMNTLKKPMECDQCGLTFSSESKYKLHVNAHRGIRLEDNSKEKVTCEICKRSMLKSSLKRHMARHKRQYIGTCEVCGYGYYTRADIEEHMRKHTGERPFVCKTCGRDFFRKYHFIKHMMFHTTELRFFCDNCNTGFQNKRTLIKHITTNRCKDFKTTGKLNKIIRRRRNELIIYKLAME